MIRHLYIIEAEAFEPWRNIALEAHLLAKVPKDSLVLYLWQNERTVVIGRNQNPWRECQVAALERDGGYLARRLSGGGAVYHDLGNLNFTFAMHKVDYDVTRQLQVLIDACARLGLKAERSGRNDVTIDGAKFSGNAFFEQKERCYHHGTILIQSDKAAIARYLTVDPRKIQGKGVASVKSRICNLTDFEPDLTPSKLKAAMLAACEEAYGLVAKPYPLSQEDLADIAARRDFFADPNWLYGQTKPFNYVLDKRFAWGGVRLELNVVGGHVENAVVESDALDWAFFAQLPGALEGLAFRPETLIGACQRLAEATTTSSPALQDLQDAIQNDLAPVDEKPCAGDCS